MGIGLITSQDGYMPIVDPRLEDILKIDDVISRRVSLGDINLANEQPVMTESISHRSSPRNS